VHATLRPAAAVFAQFKSCASMLKSPARSRTTDHQAMQAPPIRVTRIMLKHYVEMDRRCTSVERGTTDSRPIQPMSRSLTGGRLGMGLAR